MAASLQTANLFFKVSSFTRYLLEDVLPAEVYNKKNSTVENIMEECDALMNSLIIFKEKIKVSLITENVNTRDQTNSGNHTVSFKNTEPDNHKFTKLCEEILTKVVSLSDLRKFKPHYCEICNVALWYEHVFSQHCISKKHIDQFNQTSEPLKFHKCNNCHLILFAPQSEINSIISFPSHSILDEHIKKLKKSVESESKNESCLIDPEENVLEVADGTINSDIYEENCIPKKVNQLFQLMNNRLKSDMNLSEIVPHYCNICDVMVHSVSQFIQHSSSKEHISAVNSANKPIIVYKCEKCGFLITGYQNVISGILNSHGHQNLDECINSLKTKEIGNYSNENNSLPDIAGSVKETSIRNIPAEFKKAINSMIERLKTPLDFKKLAPSYCYLCLKFVYNNNDFQQHINSRKHISLASSVGNLFILYNCPKCVMSIYGTDSDISATLDSLEHINLHKRIDYLFFCNRDLSNSNKNLPGILSNKSSVNSNFASDETVRSNSSDSKKSINPNEIAVLNSNKIGCTQNKPNVDVDLKGNSAPVERLDKGVPVKFLTINSKLQCGNFTKSGFCRPCNKGINIMKGGWSTHLSCSKHKYAMEKISFENIPLRCNYCPLQILGDQIYGNVCMDVHVKLNHPNEKTIGIENEFNPFTEKIFSCVYSQSSKQSKSPETIYCIDNQPTNLQNQVYCIEVFLNFLEKKKKIFLNEGLNQFGGMCLFCVQTFEDYYNWLLHLKHPSHGKNNSEIVEKECSACNLSLYGRKVIIDSEFLSLKEHVSLDALLSQ